MYGNKEKPNNTKEFAKSDEVAGKASDKINYPICCIVRDLFLKSSFNCAAPSQFGRLNRHKEILTW